MFLSSKARDELKAELAKTMQLVDVMQRAKKRIDENGESFSSLFCAAYEKDRKNRGWEPDDSKVIFSMFQAIIFEYLCRNNLDESDTGVTLLKNRLKEIEERLEEMEADRNPKPVPLEVQQLNLMREEMKRKAEQEQQQLDIQRELLKLKSRELDIKERELKIKEQRNLQLGNIGVSMENIAIEMANDRIKQEQGKGKSKTKGLFS